MSPVALSKPWHARAALAKALARATPPPLLAVSSLAPSASVAKARLWSCSGLRPHLANRRPSASAASSSLVCYARLLGTRGAHVLNAGFARSPCEDPVSGCPGPTTQVCQLGPPHTAKLPAFLKGFASATSDRGAAVRGCSDIVLLVHRGHVFAEQLDDDTGGVVLATSRTLTQMPKCGLLGGRRIRKCRAC